MFILICGWFVGSLCIVLYSTGQVSVSRALSHIDHTCSYFFKTRFFKNAGSMWQLRWEWIFVKQQEDKTTASLKVAEISGHKL